ncbi:MAG: CpaD family pilus assembly protein [Rhodospirillaceae bacterium]|nr:CpaD family pilus assembly protein [Rhodospirillaceae bacterium]
MTLTNKTFVSSIRFLAVVGAVAASLAGCAETKVSETGNVNETYPIQVTREQVSITISLPENGTALNREDGRRFKMFLRDYVQRGRTHITVESVSQEHAENVLSANGIMPGEMIFISDSATPAPNAILSFTANAAIVPECGLDWSDNTSFNPSNLPYDNYGCATRRNMGLTVTDPGDLIESQPISGGSAPRSDAAIRTYSAPAAPAAAQ